MVKRRREEGNGQVKFSTSPKVRAYIDLLAEKEWYGSTRSQVLDYIVRKEINALRASANPPVSDLEVERALEGGHPRIEDGGRAGIRTRE